MRAWGVTSRNDLCRHLQDLGFHGVQPGQYLSRAAQEAILDQAIAADVNVALLDAAYVIVTLHLAQQPGLVAELSANLEMRQGGRNPAPTAEAPPAAAPSGSQTTATHQHPAWVRINNIDAWSSAREEDFLGSENVALSQTRIFRHDPASISSVNESQVSVDAQLITTEDDVIS